MISSKMNYSPMNYVGGFSLKVGSSFAYTDFDGKTAVEAFNRAFTTFTNSYPNVYEKTFGKSWVDPYNN